MKKIIPFIFILLFISCNFETPKNFSEKALQSNLFTVENKSINLNDILEKHKGKKILIDIWASWCADCVRGFPTIKNLHQQYPEVVFVFLSVDKTNIAWKKGISRFNLTGEHYLVENDFESPLSEFLGLSWIPHYMIIDEKGNISLFKATKATDENIIEALK